jgi:hypothetical protein
MLGSHRCRFGGRRLFWFRTGLRICAGGVFSWREIRVEKTEGVRWFDHTYTLSFLLFENLFVEPWHASPVHLWPIMMFGVITIVKPEQVIPFIVRAHSPGDWLIRITSIMKEKAVQVGAAVTQIVEGQKVDPELPVQHKTDGNRGSQDGDLNDAPPRIDRILSFDFGVNRLWIFSEVAQKNITPGIFRLSIVAMSVNGNPVVCVSVLIGPVAIAHMMPVMHMLVECLGDAQRHRFHNTEEAIQDPGLKERIVNEVMGDAVDIPRDAHRVDQAHHNEHPPWGIWEYQKQRQDVGEMQYAAQNANRIPLGIG